jgi:hypothetical protein
MVRVPGVPRAALGGVALLVSFAACGGAGQVAATPSAKRPIVLAGRTLVILVPWPQSAPRDNGQVERRREGLDSTAAWARRVAQPLGYRVEVRYGSAARLIDSRGHAIYEAPESVTSGYIIVAPYLRPLLICGPLSPEQLTRQLSGYGPVIRPLET